MRLHTLLVLLVLPSALVVVYLQSLYAQRSDFADTSRSRDALTKARVQDQLQAAAAQAQLQMGIAQGERQLQARVQAQLRAASTGPMRVPPARRARRNLSRQLRRGDPADVRRAAAGGDQPRGHGGRVRLERQAAARALPQGDTNSNSHPNPDPKHDPTMPLTMRPITALTLALTSSSRAPLRRA